MCYYCPGGNLTFACGPGGTTATAGAQLSSECVCTDGLLFFQGRCQQCTVENGCLHSQPPPPPPATGSAPPAASGDAMTSLFSNGVWSALFSSSITAIIFLSCFGGFLFYRRYRNKKKLGKNALASSVISGVITTNTLATSVSDAPGQSALRSMSSRRTSQSCLTTPTTHSQPQHSLTNHTNVSTTNNQSQIAGHAIAAQYRRPSVNGFRRPMRAVSVSASAVRHPSIGANPAQTNPSNNDSNATEKSHALESVQVTGQQQSPHAGSLVSDSASARSSTVNQEQVPMV